ncbi:MAG: hypothetical protein ACLPX9_20725 [Rhodomicrobium sp.]
MKPLSRNAFIVWGNAFWLAQSAAEVLAPQLRSYLAWRGLAFKPDLQIGCFRDSYYDSLSDRLYVVGLLWLLSAAPMTAIAWKQPENWPGKVRHFLWRRDAPGLSWAALSGVLALTAWPIVAALRAPVTSIMLLELARIALIAGPALYYRAILLSAGRAGLHA